MDKSALIITTEHPEATRRIASRVAAVLPGGTVAILLVGPLGGGKTVFVQGLAAGLGIPSRVTSPSFLIMKQHVGGVRPLRHLDLFRLRGPEDLPVLGLTDDLPPGCVVAVEWADRFPLPLEAPELVVGCGFGERECERILEFRSGSLLELQEVADALRAD